MRECPECFGCYHDSVAKCPVDGRSTFHSLPGDLALEGKYVLERRLGEGGMGIVYKAHHKFLKTTRAIKIIRPELVGNDSTSADWSSQHHLCSGFRVSRRKDPLHCDGVHRGHLAPGPDDE
jgi:serine/threonine protein kinase